jgi:bifunctional ADP-heptose synthase (sugar kinase/adenylyltransferase)
VKKPRILVIGDVIVDEYVEVSTRRQAQEAPIPVWDCGRQEFFAGGAGNVAVNVKAIVGDRAEVVLHCAGDIRAIEHIFSRLDILVTSTCRWDEIRKTRYHENGRIVARFDRGQKIDLIDEYPETFRAWHGGDRFDVVVISDYDKGSVHPIHVDFARKAPISIVDSKRPDLSMFRDVNVMKLNESEAAAQAPNFEAMFDSCIVTRGARGSEIRIPERSLGSKNQYVIHRDVVPLRAFYRDTKLDPSKSLPDLLDRELTRWVSRKRKPVDTTGCGDTHTAALAAYFAFHPHKFRRATIFANEMAAQVSDMFGVSVPIVGQHAAELFDTEEQDGVQAG